MNEAQQTPRHTLLQTPIGVRSVAAIITSATVLWYVAVYLGLREGKLFVGGLSAFWTVVYFGCPFFTLLLCTRFTRAFVHSGYRHGVIFWFTLIFALSPWLRFLFLIVAAF